MDSRTSTVIQKCLDVMTKLSRFNYSADPWTCPYCGGNDRKTLEHYLGGVAGHILYGDYDNPCMGIPMCIKCQPRGAKFLDSVILSRGSVIILQRKGPKNFTYEKFQEASERHRFIFYARLLALATNNKTLHQLAILTEHVRNGHSNCLYHWAVGEGKGFLN